MVRAIKQTTKEGRTIITDLSIYSVGVTAYGTTLRR